MLGRCSAWAIDCQRFEVSETTRLSSRRRVRSLTQMARSMSLHSCQISTRARRKRAWRENSFSSGAATESKRVILCTKSSFEAAVAKRSAKCRDQSRQRSTRASSSSISALETGVSYSTRSTAARKASSSSSPSAKRGNSTSRAASISLTRCEAGSGGCAAILGRYAGGGAEMRR